MWHGFRSVSQDLFTPPSFLVIVPVIFSWVGDCQNEDHSCQPPIQRGAGGVRGWGGAEERSPGFAPWMVYESMKGGDAWLLKRKDIVFHSFCLIPTTRWNLDKVMNHFGPCKWEQKSTDGRITREKRLIPWWLCTSWVRHKIPSFSRHC